jgi:hypothetical protein
LDFLQRRLDGGGAMPPVVEAHLTACADCRARFRAAQVLDTALARLAPPAPPALFTERLVAGVQDDYRRRRLWRWQTAGALAACVALAVWLSWPRPERPAPGPSVPDSPQVVQEGPRPADAPPTLGQGLAEAGEAVVELTRRAAAEAVGEGRQLLPGVPVPSALSAPPLGPAFDLAAGPLDDARQALTDGFEPVTTSARRAARLFLRDLPLAEIE